MSTVSLLRKLGIYVDENFLSPEICDELCQLMRSAPKSDLGIYLQEENTQKLDEKVRTTKSCELPLHYRNDMLERVHALKPKLECFFSETFSKKIESPKYLYYREGDFFSPHKDTQLNRRINLTFYLNSPEGSDSAESHRYSGGELKLYGLFKTPRWEKRGISVPGNRGTLVAYPVDVLHEVTPILSGTRFAIVSRFLSTAADID